MVDRLKACTNDSATACTGNFRIPRSKEQLNVGNENNAFGSQPSDDADEGVVLQSKVNQKTGPVNGKSAGGRKPGGGRGKGLSGGKTKMFGSGKSKSFAVPPKLPAASKFKGAKLKSVKNTVAAEDSSGLVHKPGAATSSGNEKIGEDGVADSETASKNNGKEPDSYVPEVEVPEKSQGLPGQVVVDPNEGGPLEAGKEIKEMAKASQNAKTVQAPLLTEVPLVRDVNTGYFSGQV